MQEITYSQTAIIRSCPRKYKYRYVDLLTPKVRDLALLRGTVIHESFDRYFKGGPLQNILSYILNTYDEAISKATLETREGYIIGKHMAYGMFLYYPFKDLKEFQIVYPEQRFKVRIDGLRGMKLMGKVDGLVKKENKWWIREVKTSKSPFNQVENRARVSYQASGYIYGIQKALGLKINGILFDFIHASRLQKRVNDTAESYGERILEDYANHMKDSKTGKELKESRMYRRYYSYRSPYQIREYENDITKAARKIRDSKRMKNWMRNPDVCYFYGKECSYMKICWLEHEPSEDMLRAYYNRVDENPEMN